MCVSLFCKVFWVVLNVIPVYILFIKLDSLQNPRMYWHFDKRSPAVCKTKECKAMSENLQGKINLAADPCQDFYEFTCGKYTDKIDEIDRINTNIRKQLIEIVKLPPLKNEHRAVKMTKDMFQRCLQHESNIEDLKKMITHLGGWSLFDPNWKENHFSLGKFFSKSIEIGYFPDSLFTIDIHPMPETEINTIIIGPKGPAQSILENFFRNPWSFKSPINENDTVRIKKFNYRKHKFLPEFSKKLNVSLERSVKEYEEYYKISQHMKRLNEEPMHIAQMSLSTLMISYKNIPWMEILTSIFKPTLINPDNMILIECPRCLKSLNEFLHNTSTKSLVSYLMGSFAFYSIFHADNKIMKEWLHYSREMSPEEYCANLIFSMFRRVMDYEYINRNYFDKSLTPIISNFIGKLKSATVNLISVSPMMKSKDSDTTTKNEAIAKVQEMAFKIAYDDELIKGQQALQYYDKLNLNNNSFLLSLFGVRKFLKAKHLKNFGKSAKLPYLEATDGNAVYYPNYNIFFLSLNVLSGSLFSKGNRPEYFNFGGLGNTITHEMQHAFDPLNYQFDKLGVARNWWTPEARRKHLEATECIKAQYSDFTNLETGNKVDGIQTLAENFAEIGGVEVAYKAYQDIPKGRESVLQEFPNFTFHQMFWITYGASWCSKLSKNDILRREQSDTHSIERVRVNGAVMNNKEFSADWQCKENTPMNPRKRCPVWK